MDSCSADDHLKDPVEDSDSESGSSFDNLSHWAPLRRPHPSGHGNQPPFKAQLSDTETERESERRDAGERKEPDTNVGFLFSCGLRIYLIYF